MWTYITTAYALRITSDYSFTDLGWIDTWAGLWFVALTMGFEPARVDPIRFETLRLNHLATAAKVSKWPFHLKLFSQDFIFRYQVMSGVFCILGIPDCPVWMLGGCFIIVSKQLHNERRVIRNESRKQYLFRDCFPAVIATEERKQIIYYYWNIVTVTLSSKYLGSSEDLSGA